MDDPKGDKFSLILLEIFEAVPDEIMAKAVKLAIKSCQRLPSIGDIAKCVDQCRPTPKYPGLPQPRHKIDMVLINEAFRLAIDHKSNINISDKLRTFTKKYFPDITDDLIRKNYPELSNNMRTGMKIGGHPVVMKMNKSGYICTSIYIPEFTWHKTNGIPDAFTQVFGEEA